MNRQTDITGMGVICPGAVGLDAYAEMLKTGQSCIHKRNGTDGDLPQLEIGGFMEQIAFQELLAELPISEEMRKKALRICHRKPKELLCTVLAAISAYADAGLVNALPSERVSIVIAGSNLQQEMQASVFSRYADKKKYTRPEYASVYWDTNLVGILSEILQIRGEGYTIGGASASGNTALISAYRSIKDGYADICIVVGPMAALSEYELIAFANIGALGGMHFADAPHEASRPFDKRHEGFIYGQGAGCVILESAESAKRRGVSSYVEMLGGAMMLDANGSTNADWQGEMSVMKKALADTALLPEQIDYINAHGTSTPAGDETEYQAIKAVFGENGPKVNSTKCMLGHCLCSASIMELVAVVLQMKRQFLHGNINLDEPMGNALHFVGKESEEQHIRYALSNAFGFAGINTSVILKALEGET